MTAFRLGRIVATPAALDTLAQHTTDPTDLLRRHARGDWGNCSDQDRRANDAALHNDTRIFSTYDLDEHDTIWIITEGDRSATTLLLPSDY